MKQLLDAIAKDLAFGRLDSALRQGEGTVAVFGVPDSHRGVIAAALAQERTLLLVASTETEAVRLHAELLALRPDALLFLPRDLPLTNVQAISEERRRARLSVLARLVLHVPSLIVSCGAALIERLAPPEAFAKSILTVCAGDKTEPRALIEKLIATGYERVELIEGSGQCALRGDILDVWPPQADTPYRIEFYGDEVDQLRCFDPLSQRSLSQCREALLPPAFETPQSPAAIRRTLYKLGDAAGFDAQREAWEQGLPALAADMLLPLFFPSDATLLNYAADAVLLINEPQRVLDEAHGAELTLMEAVAACLERGEGHAAQGKLLLSASALPALLSTPCSAAFYALFRSCPLITHHAQTNFTVQPAPQYLFHMDQLASDLAVQRKKREALLLYAGEAAERLSEQLAALNVDAAIADDLTRPPVRGEILILRKALPHGFVYPELHLTVLTGAELFGKQVAVRQRKKKSGLNFSDLAVGDFVVHETHGVGRFVGVQQLTVQGSTRDYLLFAYRGDDKLFIPTDQLDRIQKYIGAGEEAPPQLSKLGGNDWGQRISKARAAAKKLAVDLAELYAKRSRQTGHAFSKDNAWQQRMEESFPYEETPDQLSAIEDIKRDMESPKPMDRLLCGDVGYGKTEVTLRAAFKAVQDSKQVAFLVPTTILAQQHYNTLTTRFADFPVRVACLSRFQTPKEREEVKKKLAAGQIDVLIGTHALLSKSVHFKDLGLVIIDEEHRFGVNHKEQLKALKSEVDVLTLTATPIPRTLNLSLTGIRDISTIDTPPENRYPVQTFVMEYSDSLVKSAVDRELARGGQVFMVSNRVDGMEGTLHRMQELLPDARIGVAHGQMPELQLEKAMLAFLDREYDILLCSTIIESGVDIPNVNTLIVLEADRLGLAQLYQLRGRVGRSARMAYAYLTVYRSRSISETAQRRLTAIREFTQFGAGYRLAMRDLEIRGAGSLLGAEQHGHITDIGYEYYCKLIRQAVSEAKGEQQQPDVDIQLDVPLDAYVPRDFLKSELMRLAMYKRIADISDQAGYEDLTDEFIDRYGELPEPVMNLLRLSLIKALAANAGFAGVSIREGEIRLRYADSARPDGARLIAILSNEAGARLTSKEAIGIEILKKGVKVPDLVKILPQFLHRLEHCILPKDAV